MKATKSMKRELSRPAAPLQARWFAGLKRAARAAEDDGAKGLHGALFGRAGTALKRKKKPADARPNGGPK